jgi:hypothetical protein
MQFGIIAPDDNTPSGFASYGGSYRRPYNGAVGKFPGTNICKGFKVDRKQDVK